jgi:hypothetical protein
LTEGSFEMKRAMLWPIILGLLGLGLFFTSVAMAAPYQPLAPASAEGIPFQTIITPTVEVTVTVTTTPTTTTHPVASAMAEYFGVPYSEIEGLHLEGYGFGVISHAYFISNTLELSGTTALTLLEEFDSGKGWGVIMKDYGLHPGRAGRGGNLGTIMSGRKGTGDTLGAAQAPPGLLKKSGRDDDASNGQGPPASPPGRGHGRDKDKKNK